MTGRYSAVEISCWSHRANVLPVKDLNYRLNLPDADIRRALRSARTSQAIQTLLRFDEVCMLAVTVTVDVPLLSYSPAAVEEFNSSLQCIHEI